MKESRNTVSIFQITEPIFMFIWIVLANFIIWDDPFSMYAKFSEEMFIP